MVLCRQVKCLRPLLWSVKLAARCYGYVHVPKKKPRHILGPGGAWRKCFVVRPTTETSDPFMKYQWLTKTSVVYDLPDSFPYTRQSEFLLEDFERRATEALVFKRPPKTLKGSEENEALFQSLLASAWLRGEEFPHLLHSNLTFTPNVECYWQRHGVNYICQPRPLFILHTAQPLDLFCKPSFDGGERCPPVRHQPYHMGFFEHSFDQITCSGGCRRLSIFPFTHTLFLHSRPSSTSSQTDALALMHLFAQSAGQTVQNGYRFDKHLHYPLSNQAIVTNGREFSFYCYQLNTLDLSSEDNSDEQDGGRHNVLWIGPSLKLYEKVNPGVGLKGFNPACGSLLLQFLFNNLLRQKPTESGFSLAKAEAKKILLRRKMRAKLKEEMKLNRRRKRENLARDEFTPSE